MTTLRNQGGRLSVHHAAKDGKATEHVIEPGAIVPTELHDHPLVQSQRQARKDAGGVGGIEEIG